jgi:membrane-bound serine protease (ClpP class)
VSRRGFQPWLLAALVGPLLVAAAAARAGHVNVITIDGSINPASSDYIQQAIAQSEQEGAEALLLELDTPGGLLSSTKDIIQAMLNAEVPVIVYVSPRGAWAASAGTFITLAGHVAAMAPGTSIGAASPVSAGGGGGERDEEDARRDVASEKAEKFTMAFIESIAKERKRNVEWAVKAVREAEAVASDEALELGVVDLVAPDRDALLALVDGREVEVAGRTRTLSVADAEIRIIEMSATTRLFNFLASPDIAVLLVMAGLLGLYIEFNQPGMIVPGVLGAVCLVLAAIAFQILPFSWVGLLLMLVGLGLLIAELFSDGLVLVRAGAGRGRLRRLRRRGGLRRRADLPAQADRGRERDDRHGRTDRDGAGARGTGLRTRRILVRPQQRTPARRHPGRGAGGGGHAPSGASRGAGVLVPAVAREG